MDACILAASAVFLVSFICCGHVDSATPRGQNIRGNSCENLAPSSVGVVERFATCSLTVSPIILHKLKFVRIVMQLNPLGTKRHKIDRKVKSGTFCSHFELSCSIRLCSGLEPHLSQSHWEITSEKETHTSSPAVMMFAPSRRIGQIHESETLVPR
jgi:hypothetical protein